MLKLEEIYQDMTNTAYHARTDLLSNSLLSQYADCPARYKFQIENPIHEPTDVMKIGSLAHTYILEPESLEKEFFFLNPMDRPEQIKGMTSKINKSWKLDMEDSALEQDRIMMKLEHLAEVKKFRESLMTEHGEIKTILTMEPRLVEKTFFVTLDGVNCKIRPDLILPGVRYLNDLKTVADASPRGFQSHFFKYKYDIQLGLYTMAFKEITGFDWPFNFICVEKKAPYFTTCYTISPGDEVYQYARDKVAWLLKRFKKSKEDDYWPAYESMQPLPLPAWINNASPIETQEEEAYEPAITE